MVVWFGTPLIPGLALRAGECTQVGWHAIGSINRTVYRGAYPYGTAISFESFTV
jgi:hypothetical protein